MDKHLLALWKAVPSGNVKHEEIAKTLGFSTKQTSRYIKKWMSEGWFDYTAGRGRGNLSALVWLKDVEAIYEEQFMEIIDQQAVEESSKYLLYDWSRESKLRLLNQFRLKFGYFQDTDEVDRLIVPRRHKLLTLHPLEAIDMQSANMVANVFNRLVSVDENGVVSPEIAHTWDLQATRLRIYLHKGVKFHDGTTLSAGDVVACLDRLRAHPYFKSLWEPVTSVKAAATFVVDFYFPKGCSYCLQMLGMMNASIYKESGDKVWGTGPFYEAENSEDKTSLKAFSDYFLKRPLLDVVDFVQVPRDFEITYHSANHPKDEATFQVESDAGFGIVVMNAFRPTDIQRQEVRDYVHYVIAKHRHSISDYHPRALPNAKSCLAGYDQQYTMQKIERPHITQALVLKAVKHYEKSAIWLKDALEKEGIPVQIQWMSFAEKLLDHGLDQQGDLFLHGEVLEMNQNFSFFYFLKNSYSPLAANISKNQQVLALLERYAQTPFGEWTALNLQVEKALIESSIMIPLYYEKRQVPFSADLMNITITHFGYVDYSNLWVRPRIE